MAANVMQPASLRRRLAAKGLDAVVVVIPMIGIVAGVAALYPAYAERLERSPRLPRWSELPRTWLVGLWLVSSAEAVRGRNSRMLGARVMGLRRADARTGGPVSIRSALIHTLVTTALGQLTRRILSLVAGERPLSSRSACGRALLVPLVLEAPALWPPLHQSLPDRLAGIIVVED